LPPNGSSEEKLTDNPSISGHAKLIADFINGIGQKQTFIRAHRTNGRRRYCKKLRIFASS
jgi:hypothetical protein